MEYKKWEVRKLAEVTDINMGQSPVSTDCNEEGIGLPFYQGNAEFGRIHPKAKKYCSKPKKTAKKGDILISVRAPVGDINIAEEDCAIGRGLGAIKSTSINQKFLFYFLQSYKPYWVNVQQGTTFDAINKDDLRSLTVPYPSHSEQQKIAAILTSVDDAIEKTEAIIKQTEKVKKGLMQQLLTKGIGHTEFKQTEIGEIPLAWEVRTLEQVCSKIFVGIATSTTSSYTSNGVPIIRNQNIQENRLNSDELLHITHEFSERNASKKLVAGDVITVRTGYPGVSCVVQREFEGCHTFTTLVSRPNNQLLNSFFLARYINSDAGKRFVLGGQAGGAQQNLNVAILKKMPIPLPKVEEQQQIVDILTSVDTKLLSEHQKLTQLQTLKKALMQVLLTGKVRVILDETEAVNNA